MADVIMRPWHTFHHDHFMQLYWLWCIHRDESILNLLVPGRGYAL